MSGTSNPADSLVAAGAAQKKRAFNAAHISPGRLPEKVAFELAMEACQATSHRSRWGSDRGDSPGTSLKIQGKMAKSQQDQKDKEEGEGRGEARQALEGPEES